MDSKHWGGFLDNSTNLTSPFLLSFDDVEKLSKNVVLSSSPTSRMNMKSETMTTQMMPISYFEMDAITKHNIQLVQYSKQMEELLDQIQHSSYMKISSNNIPGVPTMPIKQQTTKDLSIKLTRKGAQQLLHKSVFTICAHEGFDRTTETILTTLAGIAEEMLIKFCNLLKVNTERELLNQAVGFTDAMERTLHDIGINGVKDLHFFYVNRVLRYNDRLRSQAELRRRACIKAATQLDASNRTAAPSTPWDDPEWTEWSGNEASEADQSCKRDSVMSRIESGSNIEAANQLHLEDNAVIAGPGLEPGLRMLHTLEQQEASGSNSGRFPHMVLMEDDSVSPTNYTSIDPNSASPAVSGTIGKLDSSRKKRKNT